MTVSELMRRDVRACHRDDRLEVAANLIDADAAAAAAARGRCRV
jgi:hypothetical protein